MQVKLTLTVHNPANKPWFHEVNPAAGQAISDYNRGPIAGLLKSSQSITEAQRTYVYIFDTIINANAYLVKLLMHPAHRQRMRYWEGTRQNASYTITYL